MVYIRLLIILLKSTVCSYKTDNGDGKLTRMRKKERMEKKAEKRKKIGVLLPENLRAHLQLSV